MGPRASRLLQSKRGLRGHASTPGLPDGEEPAHTGSRGRRPGVPARPRPSPSSPHFSCPSKAFPGSPGGNKRIKLPHKQIPQACGNNQRAMIVARTEGQRRRGPGVGSPGKGPPEEEFCGLWPAPQTFLPSGTSRACDLSAGIPITPRLPYSLGPALSLGRHCRNLPPFSSFHPNPSHSLDFYLWLKHHLNSTSL